MNPAADRTYWERHAARYDRSVRILARPLRRMLALVSDAVRGLRVLEVAAGTGLVTQAIATSAREVVATDYASAMVALLDQRLREAAFTRVHCEKADLYDLPFADHDFDAVVAANVPHLGPDFDSALLSPRRVPKPTGLLTVPTF